MADYISNSDKSRAELPEDHSIQKVTRGNVTVKKETIGHKFADTFFSDQIGNVKSYLIFDVFIPAMKDLFVDSINNGVNMLVYGTSTGRRGSSRSNGQKTSYTSYYRGSESSRSDERRARPSERRGLQEIIFETRGDAQEVMACMDEVLEKYKLISVADYYDLAGAGECSSYTDNNFGWFNLDGMTVIRDRDGYRLRLPKPESLK